MLNLEAKKKTVAILEEIQSPLFRWHLKKEKGSMTSIKVWRLGLWPKKTRRLIYFWT